MKVIYFGVSIFALVVSATSHAMEDDQTTPPCQSHQQSSQMSHPSLQWWGWVPDHSQTFHFEKEAKEDTNPLMGEIEFTDKKDMDKDKKKNSPSKKSAIDFNDTTNMGQFKKENFQYVVGVIDFKDITYMYQLEEVCSLCSQALKGQVDDPVHRSNIYLNYGRASLLLALSDTAVSCFRKALALQNSNEQFVLQGDDRARTFRDAADALRQKEKYKKAGFYDKKARDCERGRENRAVKRLKLKLEAKETVGGEYRVKLGGLDRVHTFLDLAEALLALRRYEESVVYYFKALNAKDERASFLLTDNDRVDALFHLASTLKTLGRNDQAMKFYQETELGSYRLNLQQLTQEMSKESINTNLTNRAPQNYEEHAKQLLTDAEAATRKKDYNAALAFYLQAIKLEKKGTFFLANDEIARVFLRMGDIFDEKGRSDASQMVRNFALEKDVAGAALNDIQDRVRRDLGQEEVREERYIIVPNSPEPPTPHEQSAEEIEQTILELMERLEGASKGAGNPDLAINVCDQLLNLLPSTDQRSLNNSRRAKVLCQKGEFLQRIAGSLTKRNLKKKKYEEALACYEPAKSLKDSVGDEIWTEEDFRIMLKNVEKAYNYVGNKEKAEEAKDEANRLSKRKAPKKKEIETRWEMGGTQQSDKSMKMWVPFLLNKNENEDPNMSHWEPFPKKRRVSGQEK